MCVPVAHATTLIDVTAEEDYFCNNWQEIGVLLLPMLVDGAKLLRRERSDCNRLDLVPLRYLIEICPDEVYSVRIKGHPISLYPCLSSRSGVLHSNLSHSFLAA